MLNTQPWPESLNPKLYTLPLMLCIRQRVLIAYIAESSVSIVGNTIVLVVEQISFNLCGVR